MTSEQYIKDRIDDQIKWYSQKSRFYKKFNYGSNICIAAISSLVVISTTLGLILKEHEIAFAIISLVLTSSIPVIVTTNNIMKCQELYISYRSTCELLKQEKILFYNKTGEYDNANEIEKLLVRRCESIMSTETRNWTQLNEKKN